MKLIRPGVETLSGLPQSFQAYPESSPRKQIKEKHMRLGTVLVVVLILMLVGAFPHWPHSQSWGYMPSGGLGVLLIITIVLLFSGRL
ncbi:DUF3309 domain-containing protein [Uliginosibacterium flavum]|uniref:DUF3309 domain-containing protein n=1 Tax=Uliginosibacterium flavum TaxID=1396831 RepID=UPI003F49BCBC